MQGTTTGVPTATAVNVGALTTAGNTAGAAAQAAEATAKTGAAAALPSIWIVEILGYGGGETAQPTPVRRKLHAS